MLRSPCTITWHRLTEPSTSTVNPLRRAKSLSPSRARAIQQRALAKAAEFGPAEVFLRRAVVLGAEFEGVNLLTIDEILRNALAVRVHLDGCVGLACSSMLSHESEIGELVACARRAARNGPIVKNILAPVESSPRVLPPHEASLPEQLQSNVNQLVSELPSWAQRSVLWSGRLEQVSTMTRIIHSGGLDATGGRSAWRLRLRARRPAGSMPVDRLLEFVAVTWAEIVEAVKTRVAGEFPQDESVSDSPNNIPVAFGATLVAKILAAILSRRDTPPPSVPVNDLRIDDVPAGGRFGCDDEGIPLRPIAVIASGAWCPPWCTVTEAGSSAPTGRAVRASIDMPPRPGALGLRYSGRTGERFERFILLTELAGLSLRSDGMLVGTAPEGILIENSRPLRRCKGRSICLPVGEIFGARFAGASASTFLTGPHRLPSVILN